MRDLTLPPWWPPSIAPREFSQGHGIEKLSGSVKMLKSQLIQSTRNAISNGEKTSKATVWWTSGLRAKLCESSVCDLYIWALLRRQWPWDSEPDHPRSSPPVRGTDTGFPFVSELLVGPKQG